MNKVSEYREHLYDDYVRLADVIPLDAPFTLLIDPANACNFRCTFCPTGDHKLMREIGRPSGLMDFDLFKKIIGDAKRFPTKVKKLQLYKDGEPLLNKKFAEMVAYAKKADVAGIVETTTNGALLNEELSVNLLDAGLDAIRISIEHVNDDGYRNITGTYGDYEAVKSNVARLYDLKNSRNSPLKVHVKLLDTGLKESEAQKFLTDFDGIADTLNIDQMMSWSGSNTNDRDFTLGNVSSTAMNGVTPLSKSRRVCSAPFKSMAVNFDGRVSVCCVDWKMEALVGDASEESIVDIWNGEAMREFRLTHLLGKRNTLSACAGCGYMLGFSEFENLDDSAEDLLPLFET